MEELIENILNNIRTAFNMIDGEIDRVNVEYSVMNDYYSIVAAIGDTNSNLNVDASMLHDVGLSASSLEQALSRSAGRGDHHPR